MMNKLLLLFLISLFLTSSLAEESFRNLGNKWHNKPTAAPHSENVAVTVKEENTGDNVPIDLGTTTITKSWDNPDGSHVKQVTTVEKTCLNGITTTKTTTKTYTYTNVNTEAVEGGQGENVVVVVPIEEEAECETTTTVVTEPESNAENVVVTVEQGETEENIPVDLGTTTVTKSWDNTDGSHVKQVTVIEKTCLNGLITTKTTTTTYTYTYSKPSTSTQEAEAAVESESEIEVNVEAPESVEVEVAVVQENESGTESESNIVVVEGGESTGANVAVEVEANVPKYLGTTTITKSWDTANGCHIVQVITKERTCLNGIITIKTTTKTYTYTNVSSHEEEVEAEQETEIIVVAEEEQGENVVVVVPTEEAECETTTTVETEPVNNAGNVAVEVESAEENVVQNLGTTTTIKSWTNSEGCRVKQVITVEKTCLNGVITTKTTTKTYTYPKGGSSNSGKKWR